MKIYGPEDYSFTKSFLKTEDLQFLDVNSININNNVLPDSQMYSIYN